jgi:cytochrome c biogenesis protein CcdA/glutaredoxin
MGFAANVTVYMFVGEGCPHCAQAEPYMLSLSEKYAELNLKIYEVYHNKTNAELFYKMAKAYDSSPMGVPTFFIDKEMLVGFSDGKALNPKTGREVDLETLINQCIQQGCADPGILAGIVEVKNQTNKTKTNTPLNTSSNTSNAFLPATQTEETKLYNPLTITALVITTAAADSVNPCIMAVLTFLLSALFTYTNNKRRIMETGVLYTGIVYTTYFMLGLLLVLGLTHIFGALNTFGAFSVIIKISIAALILLAGIINIKDFFWYGRGISFSIPKKYKVKIQKLSKRFAERGSITAILLIGLIVTLVEFPCSGMMYLGVIMYLITTGIPTALIIGYLLLYNIIFVIPLVVITVLARQSIEKLEKARLKYRKWFRLVLGTVLILLALLLVVL